MRPRLLDLFCGAGGAAMGYHRAGFDVVGVDVAPQPHYPFTFHQADAMTFPLDGFDVIHASPPCQDHSTLHHVAGVHDTGWMLAATIVRLRANGRPFVVENVPASRRAMPDAFTLCAAAFGMAPLKRHRRFLVEPILVLSPGCACNGADPVTGIYGDLAINDRRASSRGRTKVSMRAGVDTARRLLDCPWMDAAELTQAIPPAYTEYIGAQLIEAARFFGG